MISSEQHIKEFEDSTIWKDIQEILDMLETQLLAGLKDPDATERDDVLNKGKLWAVGEMKLLPSYLREEIEIEKLLVRKEKSDATR